VKRLSDVSNAQRALNRTFVTTTIGRSYSAGRVLGRKEACRKLDLQTEIERLNALGIIHGIREQRQLDEAPSAYKDIDLVMANQRDLVEPLVELSPIAVIKGD
jgi:tRNA-splicing ligase RtcB